MVNPASVLPSYYTSLIWGFLLLATIIIVVRVWLAVRYRDRSASTAVDSHQDVAVIQRPILTASEITFFRVLHDAVGMQYAIFPQLSLWTMIDSESTDRKTATIFRNQISLKRVDFVLADPTTLTPYMVIELDDRSHEREDTARSEMPLWKRSLLGLESNLFALRWRLPMNPEHFGVGWVSPYWKTYQPDQLTLWLPHASSHLSG